MLVLKTHLPPGCVFCINPEHFIQMSVRAEMSDWLCLACCFTTNVGECLFNRYSIHPSDNTHQLLVRICYTCVCVECMGMCGLICMCVQCFTTCFRAVSYNPFPFKGSPALKNNFPNNGGGGGVALCYQNLLPATAGKPADLLLFTSSTFALLFMIFHIVDLLTRHSPLVIYSVHTAFSFCSLVDRDQEDTAGHCHSLFHGPEKDGGIESLSKTLQW